MASVVLDASAIIALLRDEPGADFINAHLSDAAISTVNYQEVLQRLLDQGLGPDASLSMISDLSVEVVAHDRHDAVTAAGLAQATKKYGGGLGDRSCMALAIKLGVPALTIDRAWAQLAIPGLTVLLAR